MCQVSKVSIRPEWKKTGEKYNAIHVVIGGMHLRCDASGDRNVRLAYTLAHDNNAPFYVHPECDERISAVLAEYPDFDARR